MTESAHPPSRPADSSHSPGAVAFDVVGAGDVPIAVRIHHPAVRTHPEDGEVPVLLIHGFGSSGRANWSATGWLRVLERAGLTTITVDLRGHGRSGKPHDPSSYSLPILLDDLRCVIGAVPSVLGPVPAIDLVGYSMGGRLVGELVAAATASPHHPQRSPWEPGLPDVRRAVLGGYDGRPLFDTVEFTDYAAALAGTPGPDTRGRRIASIALAGRANDLLALSALVVGLSADSTSLPAEALPVQTLVVAGERDAITDRTLRWAAGLPNGHHLVLPGRDHVSAVTSGVFRSVAVDFLTASFPGFEGPIQDPPGTETQQAAAGG